MTCPHDFALELLVEPSKRSVAADLNLGATKVTDGGGSPPIRVNRPARIGVI